MSALTMSNIKGKGELYIIIGNMKSGKTKYLIDTYNKCRFCNINAIAINHNLDTRYDVEMMTSHDGLKISCIKTSNLMDLYIDKNEIIELSDYVSIPRFQEKYSIYNCDTVLINEAQFFPDLDEFVKKMLEQKKKVYVCGLDGDFERKKFGQILDLIPLCDDVIKLKSFCDLCKDGTLGIFSKRITTEKEQTVIGTDNYLSVCRECYDL